MTIQQILGLFSLPVFVISVLMLLAVLGVPESKTVQKIADIVYRDTFRERIIISALITIILMAISYQLSLFSPVLMQILLASGMIIWLVSMFWLYTKEDEEKKQ